MWWFCASTLRGMAIRWICWGFFHVTRVSGGVVSCCHRQHLCRVISYHVFTETMNRRGFKETMNKKVDLMNELIQSFRI